MDECANVRTKSVATEDARPRRERMTDECDFTLADQRHLVGGERARTRFDEQSAGCDALRAKTLTEARGRIETILRRVSRREWGRTRAKRRIEIVLARFDVESRRTRDSRNGPRAAVTQGSRRRARSRERETDLDRVCCV